MTKPPVHAVIRKKPHPEKSSARRQADGFTMLELMAILLVLSALVFTIFIKTQSISSQQQALDAAHQMSVADHQLRQFAAENGRLPCPASSTSGVENCTVAKGFLPYKTLGLATTQYTFGEMQLRYGVYRNASSAAPNDADLAVNALRFSPTDSDSNAYTPTSPPDALDFCTGLQNAATASATPSTGYTYLSWPDNSTANVAYVLAYAGSTGSGEVGLYDGLNGTSGPGFNAPGTPMSATYDDTTLSRGFNELYGMMQCDITQRSLNLAADAVDVENNIVDSIATNNEGNASQGVLMNAVGAAIVAWQALQSIAALVNAIGTEVEAAVGLALFTALCIVIVGCAEVPIYAAALVAGTIGLVSQIVAAALTLTGLGLQIAAAVFYGGISNATLTPPSGSPNSSPYVVTPATQSSINTAWDALVAAQTAATNAQNAYNTGLADYNFWVAQTNAAQTTMDTDIAAASIAQSLPFTAALDPLIYGAGSLTASTPAVVGTPTSSVTSAGTSTCTATSPVTCAPTIPYNQTTSSQPVYAGNCLNPGGLFPAYPNPGYYTTTNPGGVLTQQSCTTYKTYTNTQTVVTTTYTNSTTANWSVTTTTTNYQSVTTVSSDYVQGAQAAIDTYEQQNAQYSVNPTQYLNQTGNTPPDASQMNTAINTAVGNANAYQAFLGCTNCGTDVTNYLADYQNQQLYNYEVNGSPQVGTGPTQTWDPSTNSFITTPGSPNYQAAIPSPLQGNLTSANSALTSAQNNYNTLVCSTTSTLVGQPDLANGNATGTTPGGTGTGYDATSQQCTAGAGAGTINPLGVAASGALNILNLLRSLGLVK